MNRGLVGYVPLTDRPMYIARQAFTVLYQAPAQDDWTFAREGDVAIIPVRGPLVQHDRLDPATGQRLTSYDRLYECARAAAASDCKAGVLKIDSPGGDALGCFECAGNIARVFREAGKPLYAFCDGQVFSAAYALAVGAGAGIYTPRGGFLGSIGVVMAWCETTALDAAMGLKFYFVSSGKTKLDGNPHLPVSKEAQTRLQGKCDELAMLFFEHCAQFRAPKLTVDAVRALEAEQLLGLAAVQAGLADGIAEWGAFLAMVASGGPGAASAADGGRTMAMTKEEARAKAKEMLKGKMAEEELLAAFDEEDDSAAGEGGGEGGETDDEKKETEKKEKEAKAKAEADEKEAKAKALAQGGGSGLDVAERALARVAKLEADIAQRDEDAEKAKLIAARADFSAELRSELALLPIANVKRFIANVKPGKAPPAAATNAGGASNPYASAAAATGTAGSAQGGNDTARPAGTPTENAFIEAKMTGGEQVEKGITRNGTSLTLGWMSPADVEARAKEMNIPR